MDGWMDGWTVQIFQLNRNPARAFLDREEWPFRCCKQLELDLRINSGMTPLEKRRRERKKIKKHHGIGVATYVNFARNSLGDRCYFFFFSLESRNKDEERTLVRFVSTTIIMKRVSALSIRLNRSWPISSNVLDLFTPIPMLSVAVCP